MKLKFSLLDGSLKPEFPAPFLHSERRNQVNQGVLGIVTRFEERYLRF
jgi:hypothetical protein